MKALSIRQPWAHAILHFGKDVENRIWQPRNSALRFRGRVLLHAAKGCTRNEYGDAAEFIWTLTGKEVPLLADLPRGAIVGAMTIADVVTASGSKWFEGGCVGLVLRDVVALPEPIPCIGALGYFRVPEDVAARIRELSGRAA